MCVKMCSTESDCSAAW
ncbi:hypothetical protein BS333_14605 [Vibrio azureus]|nr:hypothetical protein BS333_14605 [Vibrio azureus]